MPLPRCLITAGPTREYFDPVRFLSNPSTGKMGFALAQAALELGWDVDLVAGPTCLTEPQGAVYYPVETGEEMLAHCEGLFPACDILLMTAAVTDYKPLEKAESKMKKGASEWTITWVAAPDILSTLSAQRLDGQILCGFAAETENIETNALEKLQRKNLDWIFANKVGVMGSGFGADSNEGVLLGKNGERHVLGPKSKSELALDLLGRIYSLA